MKIKQLVLASLIVFALGFGAVILAGLFLPEGTRLGGPAGGLSSSPGAAVGGEQLAADGTPIITPHTEPGANGNGGSSSNSGSSAGSSGSGSSSGATSGGGSTSGGSASSGGSTSTGGSGTSSGGGTTTSPKPTTTTSTTPKPSTTTPPPTTTVTPKPSTTTPPPVVGCGSPGGVCSAAQVATHNTSGNCWVIYNGGYYIVTAYVRSHPGGTGVFNASTCGKDITSYMNGSASTAGARHSHSGSAYNTLNSYYVGKVQ